MKCVNPINAYRTSVGVFFAEQKCKGYDYKSIKISCGQCIGCRLRRAKEWSIRITHEQQLHERNCFLTLTYDPKKIQETPMKRISLDYEDIQKFYKRVRKKYKLRHFTAGEYGEVSQHAHWHACIFGQDWKKDSAQIGKELWTNSELEKMWGYGNIAIGQLTMESANYVARYQLAKINGQRAKRHYETILLETGEIIDRAPEMVHMSRDPAIGFNWLKLYWPEIKNGTIRYKGNETIAPKAYRNYFQKDSNLRKEMDANIDEIINERIDTRPEIERLRAETEIMMKRQATFHRNKQ